MASTEYARDMTRASVAKILQTIGWHTSHASPLEILSDIACEYIKQLGKMTNDYANLYNMTEANLDHIGLAFNHFHINLPDLEEYVSNVDIGPLPVPIPSFPVSKENHLNFLKPGSKECVTRPVHIHEHLPPMYNVQEANETEAESSAQTEEVVQIKQENTSAVFKRPAEISPSDNFKRPRLLLEEEGRPTREISSVMMTTSGFISPAREGKLPESRTPFQTLETAPTPSPTIPTPINAPTPTKPKSVKRMEKKKEKKDPGKPPEEKLKKIPPMKDVAKMKMNADKHNANNSNNDIRPPPKTHIPKVNKTLAIARMKTDKCNTTITPIPMKPTPHPPIDGGKLCSEPDRKKANIFRKISHVKSEKAEHKQKIKEEIKQESRETSPVLIIDEPMDLHTNRHNLGNDVTIELVEPKPQIRTPDNKIERAAPYFSDDSPPGTPLTPRTPEMIPHSPPLTKEKHKRKSKPRVKKVPKSNATILDGDFDMNCRPKTPEGQLDKLLFPFAPFPPFPPQLAPGLIPNSLFAGMPGIPPMAMPMHRRPCPPLMMQHHMEVPPLMVPKEEFVPKPQVKKQAPPPTPPPPIVIDDDIDEDDIIPKLEKKSKEHKKEKKDKVKKKNKKDKVKDKAEKKKLKEEKKEKIKKEKKEKKKDKDQRDTDVLVPKLTLKLGSPSPSLGSDSERKLNIKPVIKKEDETIGAHHDKHREVSPELAKISALVTGQPKPKSIPIKEEIADEAAVVPPPVKHQGPGRPRIHPVKQKPVKTAKQQPPPAPQQQQLPIKDAEGKQIWICPACRKPDDGSPMIGCDDCDAWYHWVCVGIQVPPDDNENWYCRFCLSKKQEVLQTDKKKKRKKREKKEH